MMFYFYKIDALREYLYSTNNDIVNEFAYSNKVAIEPLWQDVHAMSIYTPE